MPVVWAQGVTKVFGEGAAATHALRGVDLAIEEGEVVFLVGPSGSGKTTLLSILGGVLSATSGRVVVQGLELTALGQRELAAFRLERIGFVFQGSNLIGALDALGNARLPLLLGGVVPREADRRAAEDLRRVGLGDKLASRPTELSEGQKQRVAVVRAAVSRPPILLADEPTASLDARTGHEVMELLAGMARERGHTVVVVTHDPRIYGLADRVVAIEDGRIVPPGGADGGGRAR